jgi:hypothetical protein
VAEGLSCSAHRSLCRAGPFVRRASMMESAQATIGVLLGKQTPAPRVMPLAPAKRRVAPAIVEPESHLTLPPT